MLAFIPILGFLDRFIGWGGLTVTVKGKKYGGRTFPVLAALILLPLAAWLDHLPISTMVFLPVAFFLWRTPPWGLFGGSINPSPVEWFGTFKRHLLALAFSVPLILAGVNPIAANVLLIIFALSSTALALLNHVQETKYNWFIETSRGVLLGWIIFLLLTLNR